MYGQDVFYNDAINYVLQDAYKIAVDESKLDIVSRPDIDVVSVSKEDGVSFTAIVYTKPELTISEYKGIPCSKHSSTVSADDIKKTITKELEKHSRLISVTDRAVKDGDTVNIDFEGFIDDVAFNGGKGEKYDLVIGSNTFIDSFEKQLVGKNIGDDIDVNVTFPKEYGQKDLASKPALFKVKINEIKETEIPELTDKFVQDSSEFENIEDYKKDIKDKLITARKKEVESKKREEVLENLSEKAIGDIPEAMVELEIDQKIAEFKNQIASQGLSIEDYLSYMGQSIETMREAHRIICQKQIRGRLALEAVAKAENISVSDKEISKELERIAVSYNIDKEKIESIFGEKEKQNIIEDLKVQKALDFVLKNSIATEKDK